MSIEPGWKPDPDFLERYAALRILGQGGMGAVFLARDLRLRRPVAIKFMRPDRVKEDRRTLKRFTNEARFTAGLKHPSIVEVYDAGVTAGQAYIVYEYVPGRDLKSLLVGATAGLEPELVRVLGLSMASALDHAHVHGLIHRDVKPHNVLLVEGWEERFRAGVELGWAKLTDFGLAKRVDDEATMMTRTGLVVGTPNYMAPEQVQGKNLDGRTDVYALGVVLYSALAGPGERRCFLAFTRGPLPDLAELVPAAGPELAAAVMKAMATDPRERWATAGAFAEALRAAAPPVEISGTVPLRPPLPAAGEESGHLPAEPAAASGSTTVARASSRRRLVAGILLGVAFLLFGLAWWHRPRGPRDPDLREPRLILEPGKDRVELRWTSREAYRESFELRNARGRIPREGGPERRDHALSVGTSLGGRMELDFGRGEAPVRARLHLPSGRSWPGRVAVDGEGRLTWTLPWLSGGGPDLLLLDEQGRSLTLPMDSSPPALVVTGSLFRRRSVAALRWSTMTVTAFGEPRPHATLHVELLDPPVTGLEPETLTLTLARELEERSKRVGWSDFAALLARKDSAALLVFDPPEQGGVLWKDRPFGEAMRFLEGNMDAFEAALASSDVPLAARLRLHQAFFSFLLTGRAVVCNRKLLLQKGVVGLARPTARFLKVLRQVEGALSHFASTTAEHFDRPLPEGSSPGRLLATFRPPSRNCSYFVAGNANWEGSLVRRGGGDAGTRRARSLDGAMPNSPYNLLRFSDFNRKLLEKGFVGELERRGLAARLRQTGLHDAMVEQAVSVALGGATVPQAMPVAFRKARLVEPALTLALGRGDLSKDLMARAVARLGEKGMPVGEKNIVRASAEILAEHWKVADANLGELFAAASGRLASYLLGFLNPIRSHPFLPLVFRRPHEDRGRWIELVFLFHGLSDRHVVLLDLSPKDGGGVLAFDARGRDRSTLRDYLEGLEFRAGDVSSYEIDAPVDGLTRLVMRLPAELAPGGLVAWRVRLLECTPSMYFRYPMLLSLQVRSVP